MNVSPPTDLSSAGHLAASLTSTPSQIDAVVRRLDISPAVIIDGRRLYSDHDAQRIAEALRAEREVRVG